MMVTILTIFSEVKPKILKLTKNADLADVRLETLVEV